MSILKRLNKVAVAVGAPVVGRSIDEQLAAINAHLGGTTNGANIEERVNEYSHVAGAGTYDEYDVAYIAAKSNIYSRFVYGFFSAPKKYTWIASRLTNTVVNAGIRGVEFSDNYESIIGTLCIGTSAVYTVRELDDSMIATTSSTAATVTDFYDYADGIPFIWLPNGSDGFTIHVHPYLSEMIDAFDKPGELLTITPTFKTKSTNLINFNVSENDRLFVVRRSGNNYDTFYILDEGCEFSYRPAYNDWSIHSGPSGSILRTFDSRSFLHDVYSSNAYESVPLSIQTAPNTTTGSRMYITADELKASTVDLTDDNGNVIIAANASIENFM